MHDQQVVGQVDADDFQFDTAIIHPDPQQSIILSLASGYYGRLASAVHCSQHVSLADAPLARPTV